MPKLSALHHQAFLQLQECYQEQIKQVKNIPLNLANLIEIYSGPRDQVVAFKICLETLKNEEVFKENIPPFIDEFQRCKLMRVCRLLFAAGILNSIDAVDNFNLIVKHKNLNA